MTKQIVSIQQIEKSIYLIRAQKVMFSQDLPILYMRAFVKLRAALEPIDAILEAIRQLMAPPEKPCPAIGFHVRETAPRYETRQHL